MRLSVTVYPPGNHTMDNGPDRETLGHPEGTGGTPPGSPTSQVRIR